METAVNPIWPLLQISDSAFPTGGFSHSGGLEAALQQGEIQGRAGLDAFLSELLWQTGHGGLVLATAVYDRPESLAQVDQTCDVFLSGHVANRASRVQGRTYFSTCERSFPGTSLERVARVTQATHSHFAPVFGAVFQAMDVGRETMQQLHLHFTLRGAISAAIRLGVLGPYEAQRVQSRFAPVLDKILARCAGLSIDDLAQTAPLLDLFQSNHDRLYSRLFQS